MSNELYQISSWQEEPGSIVCSVHYNKSSDIFGGHFPDNPIVPGVCTMQMITDLLQRTIRKELRLINASSVKFLQLITPDIEPLVSVTWTVSGNSYITSATLKEGAVTLFKMSAVYAER